LRLKDDDSANSQARILAVDDIASNLIALQAALSEYELVCVQSGYEAVVAAKDEEFALVLLDVQMPGIDGFETAKLLRKDSKSSETPIIFLTAIHRDDKYVEQGYIDGAVDYLFKPLNIRILQSKVSVFVDLFRKTKEIQRQAEREKAYALKDLEIRLLKNAVEKRDEFLSITSHELKTPLTPLLLQAQRFLELIESDEIKTFPKPKLLKMWGLATAQVKRLSRLVNDLLDLTRISEGKLKLRIGEFDLCELIRRVIDEFDHEITKAGFKVELRLPAAVLGNWDESRIEQVVVNLLTNALRYARERTLEISVSEGPDEVIMKFTDSGVGIPEQDKSRIFSKFERAVSSEHYGGLGLGLYICKNIVQAHGGQITVDSTLGVGSTFTVTLPRTLVRAP
jgi:signal transduction histidine kinase